MTLSKARQQAIADAQAEAIKQLREWLPPGAMVRTVLRHRSQSGMLRAISPIITVDGEPFDATWYVSRALGWKVHQEHYGITVGGAGMDMGYHLVYSLSRTLYPDEWECIDPDGERHRDCPANDHVNRGDEDNRQHRDGGYALRHRWL